ncbi:glycosyltransferase family 4 protein [Limibacter armeniacum]|uniref:glycosyltransferase family 4 protein n=1 Tax=Limibacter armeniacum TaxID=466084 RepID=UPI002FE5906B
MTKKLNIVFATAADLPEGGGNTTRLKTLVAALRGMGHKVRLLLEHSHGSVSPDMLQLTGDIDGAPFEYIIGTTKKPEGYKFFTKKLSAVFLMRDRIKALHAEEPIDILWFNHSAAHLIYPLSRLAHQLSIKTVHSYEDERVKGSGLKRKLIYANQSFADNRLTKQADHLIVISNYLKEKYAQLTQGKVPITLIPTIIKPEYWDCTNDDNNHDIPLLMYSGGFYGFDEVEEVIKAIRILKDRNLLVNYHMIGYNKRNPAYMESINQLIKSNGLDEQVKMLGFTPFAELKGKLAKANLLIGIRKDDEWSSTGFSTKLSEYLATGRPILCAALGDNTYYLKNGENAFMVQPGAQAQEIADAIQAALTDKERASTIGKKGQEVALAHFSQKVAQKELDKVFDQLFCNQ